MAISVKCNRCIALEKSVLNGSVLYVYGLGYGLKSFSFQPVVFFYLNYVLIHQNPSGVAKCCLCRVRPGSQILYVIYFVSRNDSLIG